MPLLQNHIAVVTGAGSGIGRAIAAGYAREGARVVLLDMNEKAAAEAAQEIRDAGGKAESFRLDVTRRDDCVAVAKQIADKVGPVSILVNNAGIARRNGMLGAAEAVIKDWEDIIAINLTGVFNVTHAFLGAVARRPRGASSISARSSPSCICARRVRRPTPPPSTACSASPRRSPPNSARTACASTRSAPGFIETPLNEKVRASNPELVKSFIDHTPLGRAGKAEDIVGPAIFLASDLSAYVSGSIVMVDGGYRTI